MQLRIMIEPQQGASYDDQLAIAKAAEQLGFNGFFRSDHFLTMGGDGLPGPTDSWVTLAGLARETSRIRLGTLVSSATFRHPGMLAIQVAQVDQMSGGRVELGLGAGWYEAEHRAYGIPFPQKRFGLLEEQLAVITGLWETPIGERFRYAGQHYTITDSPALPKPAQARVPVIVGGKGPRRTPALAARYATEYNMDFPTKDTIAGQFAVVRQACEAAGRDPDELTYSVALVLVCGRDEAELRRRAAVIGKLGRRNGGDLAELRRNGLAGTPQELVDEIAALDASGVDRIYLQVLDLHDLDHLELVAADVASRVAG